MKAACVHATGPPDCIEIQDVADPTPGDGQVLIDVTVSAVNPIDTYVRSGAVAFELPTPYFPGCDAAGVVSAVGPKTGRFQVGDRVWCTNQGLLGRQGTLAEKIVVDEDWCYATPDEVSDQDAAACALVGVTAHLGLFREARLQPGETVLVIGGTGGVGSMVVQMAKAAGATVIATAGSAAKKKRAMELGADVAIDYSCESIAEATKAAAPDGVNVFWETRREPDFDFAVDLMASHGRMVVMAGRDARPAFPVGPFYVKECSLHGFVMFKGTPVELRNAAEQMNRWMSAGKVLANVGATFSLDQAAEAHRVQEAGTLKGSGDLSGKVIVRVGG